MLSEPISAQNPPPQAAIPGCMPYLGSQTVPGTDWREIYRQAAHKRCQAHYGLWAPTGSSPPCPTLKWGVQFFLDFSIGDRRHEDAIDRSRIAWPVKIDSKIATLCIHFTPTCAFPITDPPSSELSRTGHHRSSIASRKLSTLTKVRIPISFVERVLYTWKTWRAAFSFQQPIVYRMISNVLAA